MSVVINNSRSLLKSIDALNCETSRSSIIIKDITLNTNKTENSNKIYKTAVDQPTDAIDYYSFSSDTNEMYYSDSEGSNLLILPQRNTFVHNMPSVLHQPSSSDSDIDYCKVMNNKPLATSSPLNKLQNSIENKYYENKTSKKLSIKLKMFNDVIKSKSKSSKVKKCYKNSDKTISSYTACLTEIPNLSKKTASTNNSHLLLSENQEKTDKHTKHSTFSNIRQVSQKSLNDVTNILYTNQSQITLQKSSFTKNMTLNKKSEKNAFQLNVLSDKTVNSNPNESNKNNKIDQLVYTAWLTENPNLSNKNALTNHNNLLLSENQEKTDKHTKHSTFSSIKQDSQKSLNDMTNMLYTNQSQITLQKSSFTTNTMLNKKSENNAFQLNVLSDNAVNSNPNKSNKIDIVYSECLTDIPNLSSKTASPNYNNLLLSENQEKTDKHTKHSTCSSINQVSQKSLHDVTNMLYTNQSQITLQKSSFTTNMTLSKNIENHTFQLNLLSDETLNSNPNESNKMDLVYSLKSEKISTKNKIEENQKLYKNTTIIYNSSQITNNIYKHTAFDENCLNNTDLSDIFQMELSLKMFSGNIVPYLNSMKHEILQIMNKCMYKPDKQITKRSKHVNDIIKNIHNIMKANVYNNCIDSLSNKKECSTIPFVGVDLNNLNVLSNKLECLKKKLKQVKLFENILNDREDKSTDQFYVQNDFLEFKSLDNLKSFKPSTDNTDAVISSNKTAALDSFSCMRELNKSNSLLQPISDCININETSQKPFLENCSLICMNDLPTNEISKTIAQDLSFLSYNEPLLDKLAPINDNLTSQFEDFNYNDNPVGKNQSRYWLRKNPKSTDHYFSPFLKTSFKTPLKTPKKSCIKSKYNDMFICTGTGNKKVIHQYKLKSVLKANSDELIKMICPESKNIDSQNTTAFDISNLKPKKNEKPCRCGIFPSQVPSSWNDPLHVSLHKNLHKLQFKSQLPVNVVSKINDNGFIFDIVKVTENCDDLNLRLTLKNIQDFIRLEIDFSKKSINNLNHTIFLAVDPKFKIIGYLEIEPLTNACIYQNSQLSKNLIAVKFGISKLWVMVKYRNNGVATKLLKQFCDEENLQTNDIAFEFHGNHGISFIKKHFANNPVLIY